jgi:hypothetical protein
LPSELALTMLLIILILPLVLIGEDFTHAFPPVALSVLQPLDKVPLINAPTGPSVSPQPHRFPLHIFPIVTVPICKEV